MLLDNIFSNTNESENSVSHKNFHWEGRSCNRYNLFKLCNTFATISIWLGGSVVKRKNLSKHYRASPHLFPYEPLRFLYAEVLQGENHALNRNEGLLYLIFANQWLTIKAVNASPNGDKERRQGPVKLSITAYLRIWEGYTTIRAHNFISKH